MKHPTLFTTALCLLLATTSIIVVAANTIIDTNTATSSANNVNVNNNEEVIATSSNRLLRTRTKHKKKAKHVADTEKNKRHYKKKTKPDNNIIPSEDTLQLVKRSGGVFDPVMMEGSSSSSSSSSSNSGSSVCVSIIAVEGHKRFLNEPEFKFGNEDYEFGSNDNDDDKEKEEHDTTIPYVDEGFDGGNTEEEFVCERVDGSTTPISGTDEQIRQLRIMLNSGDLVSAESNVEVEQPLIISGIADGIGDTGATVVGLMDSSAFEEDKIYLPPGEIKITNNNDNSNNDIINNRKRRRLQSNMYEGTKKVLVVRVIDKEKKAVDGDAAMISDKWFGTNNDPFTVKSGFDACSFGKFKLSHEYNNNSITKKLAAPGVLEVTLDIKLKDSNQATLRSAVQKAVGKKLGFGLPGPFDHVAFVVEDCYMIDTTCSFAAYAYVNHWMSLFIADNYKYPAVVIHEIGHNLNLAHSGGLDGRTYTDHTCLMGNPYFSDNYGKMCFNPVKNFQIAKARRGGGWYDTNRIRNFNSGTTGGTSWSGRLVGIADYERSSSSNHPIVLKLESGNGADWFLGFNRGTGINVHTKEARDRVTIYKVAGGDGMAYSTSALKGSIKSGRSETISNWRKSGIDLIIKVKTINTSANVVGYADVEITFGSQSTPNPTKVPTKNPTSTPTIRPTSFPTKNPTRSPSKEPTGVPTMSPTLKPVEVTRDPTRSPGKEPTNVPTMSPTMKPVEVTKDPTRSPSKEPTNVPTSTPTLKPIVASTPRPTVPNGIRFFDSGTTGGTSWSDRIFGMSHTSDNDSDLPIIVSLVSDNAVDWFVGFNDIGVVVYTETHIVGALIAGQSETITNWRNSGLDLVVEVREINTDVSPGYADIEIRFGSQDDGVPPPLTSGPTPSPSRNPTDNPTRLPSDAPSQSQSSPRCGNSVCDNDETPDICPADCVVQTFETKPETNANSRGQLFTIETDITSGVKITSFDVVGDREGRTMCRIYTRDGDYQGYEQGDEGWESVLETFVNTEQGARVSLGSLDREVAIPAGSRQAFYIWCKNGMLYTKGSDEGVTFDGDGSVFITEGIGTKRFFRKLIGKAQFSGWISYYLAAQK